MVRCLWLNAMWWHDMGVGRAEASSSETRTMTSKDGSTLVNLEDVALPGQGWEVRTHE